MEYAYKMYTPIPKDFVVIDFETANYNQNSICQMGIAVVENNLVVEQKDFLICPPSKTFYKKNIDIHGITFSDVKDKPNFAKIWTQVQKYIQGRTVTAYNLPFDIGCLYAALENYQIPAPDFVAFDILANVRYCRSYCYDSIFKELEDCKLITVAKLLKLNHNAHDALSDSEVAAKIQIYISKNLPDVMTEFNFSTSKAIYDAIAKRKISLKNILQYSKDLAKTNENLNYDEYKELLKLLEQVAAQNEIGILYRDCGMLYEKLEKLPRALSLYKTALNLDKNLKLKTRIQNLERELRKNS